MSDTFEIEIKSLLGSATAATSFTQRLLAKYPQASLTETSSQLNHYFVGDDALLPNLATKITPFLNSTDQTKLRNLIATATKASVRTRLLNQTVLIVVKASIDDTTSSNGIARMEFEAPVTNLTIDQLDELVVSAGYTYQAKWSRDRQTYRLTPDTTISLDKNAGYGYLAEFEKLVNHADQAAAAQTELRQLMSELGAAELAQDRLERMFAFYNEHWPEYYGTDHTFSIE